MKKLKRVLTYLFLTGAAVISIFPFLWMIVSMTNKSVDVTKGRLLPGTHFVENITTLFETVDIVTALVNSAIIAIVSTFLTLLLASLAGYGFEMYRSPGKDRVFNILLVSMMIPFAAIMIPLYRLFGGISDTMPFIGIDTLASALLPTIVTAFFIFFFQKI